MSNKESRISQIREMYKELEASLDGGVSQFIPVEPLKGRLLYAAGHTYGALYSEGVPTSTSSCWSWCEGGCDTGVGSLCLHGCG